MDKILVDDDDDALRGLLKMRLSDTYETIDTGNRCRLSASLWGTNLAPSYSI
jgi:hypothetical protein